MATTNANNSRAQDNRSGDSSYKAYPAPYQKSRGYGRTVFIDKDEEDDRKYIRSHKITESKRKTLAEQAGR